MPFYKIVSKIMVERLKECMTSIISLYQIDFVPRRNIHENIIIAQEMIHSLMKAKGKKKNFVIKVDLSKAYDKLHWNFILNVLSKIGIPDQMKNVIMRAVTSVETNFKWNGARGEYFRPQHGIIQGDPISLYLFVMCIDSLSYMISQAVNEGHCRAFRDGRNGTTISHLMFADDLLLFRESSEKQIKCVMHTLDTFCRASG